MLSPEELYREYSTNPCTSFLPTPFTQITASKLYNQLAGNDMGAGTPMNWQRMVNFLKLVKYPCVENAPGYNEIVGTGTNKLSPTFKFLQQLDIEAYKESQPSVQAGTSYSVRNCIDLSRACHHVSKGTTKNWTHRMATEYMEYFAHRSLPDCLLMCGPDLVGRIASLYYRGPGGKVSNGEPVDASGASYDDPDGTILNNMVTNDPGMLCFPLTSGGRGAAGARHSCWTPSPNITGEDPKCYAYDQCPKDPNTGEITMPNHPCCKEGSIFHINECQNNHFESVVDSEVDFSYWIPSDDGVFDGTVLNGRLGEILKHVGILERKIYHGYADFSNQCDGTDPPISLKDIFLSHFQEINGFNYNTNKDEGDGSIERARTVSIILKATVTASSSSISATTDKDWMLARVKDLLYNGYGVMLQSNTGFHNSRDSTGISYPDRIFYHTYNIIGYDDTRIDYPECVYVLQLPFGEWNTGGHPTWGPLPTGSFLVTESHLKCLIDYYPTSDWYNCREEVCINTVTNDCNDQYVKDQYKGCGSNIEGRCDPYYCTPQQRACGFLFAVSTVEGFPAQSLNYEQFYPLSSWKEHFKERPLYYKPPETP